MPKGYFIGHVTVKDPEAQAKYVENVAPSLQGLAVHSLARGAGCGVMKRQARPVMIKVPNHPAAVTAIGDRAYHTGHEILTMEGAA